MTTPSDAQREAVAKAIEEAPVFCFDREDDGYVVTRAEVGRPQEVSIHFTYGEAVSETARLNRIARADAAIAAAAPFCEAGSLAGLPCEKVSEHRHVRGVYWPIPGYEPHRGVVAITEIVRGSLLHIEDPTKLVFSMQADVTSAPMLRAAEADVWSGDDSAHSTQAASAKTEDEAIEAVRHAFWERYGFHSSPKSIQHIISAYHQAKFGGDPEEIIAALKSECEIVAGGDMILVTRQAANRHRQLNRDLSQKVDDQSSRIAQLEALLEKNVNAELIDQQQAMQEKIAQLEAQSSEQPRAIRMMVAAAGSEIRVSPSVAENERQLSVTQIFDPRDGAHVFRAALQPKGSDKT